MRHAEARIQQLPLRVDDGGIGFKPNHHPGTVPAEVPNRTGHTDFRLGRHSVKPSLAFLIPPGATLDTPLGDVMPSDVVLGQCRNGGADKKKSDNVFHGSIG